MPANYSAELIERFERIAVAAVSDVLDKHDLWNQLLPHDISPLAEEWKVAGPAFTIKAQSTAQKEAGIGPRVIEELTPGAVIIWDTTGEQVASHWGDLMSTAAKATGARGVVVDGGVRDVELLHEIGLPVFAKYRTAAGTPGRSKITEINQPVRVGGVLIRPGDFIFGDRDGVIVIPAEIVEEVLSEAEDVTVKETAIREAVASGATLFQVYEESHLLERR